MPSGIFLILVLLIILGGSVFFICLILALRKKERYPIISRRVRVENKRKVDTIVKGDDGVEVDFTSHYITFLEGSGATTEYKVPLYDYNNLEEGCSGVLKIQNNNFLSFVK